MDPMTLYAQPEVIREKVGKVLQDYGHGSGHVFNLGHGLLPDVPPEHVKVMVDTVQNLARSAFDTNVDTKAIAFKG